MSGKQFVPDLSTDEYIPEPGTPKYLVASRRKIWQDAKKASLEVAQESATEDYSQFMDSVPDVSSNAAEDEKRLEVVDRQQFIDRISILDVYKKLTGKTPLVARGQTESIMGFCVNPHHDNNNDEAMWMNSTKNTWNCEGQCKTGGSQVGMVAASQGVDDTSAGKLRGQAYAKAEEQLLEMFGWTFRKQGNTTVAKSPDQQKEESKAAKENSEDLQAAIKKSEAPAAKKAETGVAEVISITRSTDDVASNSPLPTFDWEKVVTPDTAIDAYMQACRINAVPEEFHFFNAMMLVGLAAGRNTCGPKKDQFYANISPILVGNSGVGKSLSWKPVFTVLRDAMPFDVTPGAGAPIVRGATVAHGPGSGEDLYDVFSKYKDPATGKFVDNMSKVRAVITYGEVSHFMAKTQNKGSVLESSIQNLYDSMFETGLRSRSGGETKAREPFMCLMSTSQPRVIGKTFTSDQVANGLAGRLDFVTGTYKEPDPFSNEVGNLYEAVEKYQELREWAESEPRHLEWSDDAALLWADYFSEKIRPIKRNEDPSTDILKRMDLKMKKFALIFAINEMHEEIERSDLEKAISMHDYIKEVLSFIAGTIGKSKNNEVSEKIFQFVLDYYKRNNKACTMRDIKRWGKPKFNDWEDADYINTLKQLEQLGEVVIEEHKPKRGPATYTYQPHAEMVR